MPKLISFLTLSDWFFFVLPIFVLGGVTGFMVYRSGQERRILNLRLQLARNFHDEIGPMLLYANVLAKKQQNEELRGQIGLIMDAVRNIAHDLKSPEANTIASLGRRSYPTC